MNRDEFIVCREYASVDLLFSLYLLEETVSGTDTDEQKRELYGAPEKGYYDWLCAALRKLDRSVALSIVAGVESDLRELRKEIKKRMDFFAELTDNLIAYEYVLNRLELKFSPEDELDEFLRTNPEEDFLRRIMSYISADGDSSLMGIRLNSVVGEIPVQITKNKLFEWIDKALTLYLGSDETSIDEQLYMIRTAGLVGEPSEYLGEYRVLEEPLRQFGELDLKNITEDEYNNIRDKIFNLSEKLEYVMDYYVTLQRCVNDTLSLCLVIKWLPDGEGLVSKDIENTISKWLGEGLSDDDLVPYEGRIEGLSERLQKQMIKVEAPDMNSEAEASYIDVATIARLLSNSPFAEIDPLFVESREVTRDMIREKEDELFDELSSVLSGAQKPVKKAIMAKVMEKLPPFLNSKNEIEDYIRTNLFGCRSKSEKVAVMAILIEMMEDELM